MTKYYIYKVGETTPEGRHVTALVNDPKLFAIKAFNPLNTVFCGLAIEADTEEQAKLLLDNPTLDGNYYACDEPQETVAVREMMTQAATVLGKINSAIVTINDALCTIAEKYSESLQTNPELVYMFLKTQVINQLVYGCKFRNQDEI